MKRMTFEEERIAHEKGVEFDRVVAEKLEAIDVNDLSHEEFIAATVKAINKASAEVDPDENGGELVYELDEDAR